MPKTYYLDNNMINATVRGVAFSSPSTVYVALFTAAPTVNGGGTEVSTSGTAYTRQTVTFAAPVNGMSSNTTDVTFPVASAAWGTVVSYALMDAVTAGNMLYFGTLSTPRTVDTTDQLRFPAGQLVLQET